MNQYLAAYNYCERENKQQLFHPAIPVISCITMTSSQSLVSGLNRISMYTGRVDMMSYSSCFITLFLHNMDNYHVNQCKTAIVVPPAPLSSFRVFLLNLFADSSSISILGLSETIKECFCCLCVCTLLIVQQEGTWNNGTWQQIQKYKAFFNCAQLKKEKKIEQKIYADLWKQ